MTLDHQGEEEIGGEKVIILLEWCQVRNNVNLGVKGDVGDSGVRGPRGLIGAYLLKISNVSNIDKHC